MDYILGDDEQPVSDSPSSVVLQQRAAGCLLAGETGQGKERAGSAVSLTIFVLIIVLDRRYLVELTAVMKVFYICTVQHSSGQQHVAVGHWKCEESNGGPVLLLLLLLLFCICSFK